MRHHHAVVLCLTVLGLTGATGCQIMTPTETKTQAQDRWNHIRADFKMQLARQHYDAKLFHDAQVVATEALAFDPALTPAYVLLAKTYLELGKPASAQRSIEAARRVGLDSSSLTYMQGVVAETMGHTDMAAAYYTYACEDATDNVDYMIAYAESMVALGRPDMALRHLDAAIGRYDDNGSALLLSAHIASLMGDVDGAIRRYRVALDALGESRIASRELGLLLVQSGRYEEAIESLAAIMTRSSNGTGDDVARHALATAYLRMGRPMTAISWLTPESRGEAKAGRGYQILAEAALATNDISTGVAAAERALRDAPDDPGVVWLYAAALWRQGDNEAAEQRLTRYLDRHHDDATAHCLLAEVLRSQGATEDARDHFRRASELSGDSAWAAQGLEALDRGSLDETMTDDAVAIPSHDTPRTPN